VVHWKLLYSRSGIENWDFDRLRREGSLKGVIPFCRSKVLKIEFVNLINQVPKIPRNYEWKKGG